jgi:trehalose 6-phosphate phosphatase
MNSSLEKRPKILKVPDFWSRLRSAPERFLALDYDGTLAPFHVNRMKAHPLPGVTALLKTLGERKDTTVVIVSGRPVAQIQELIGNLGITLVGSHGYERLLPGGRLVVTSPRAEQTAGLNKAEEIAVLRGLGQHLERKIASLALHTRGIPKNAALRMESETGEEWSRLAARHKLECRGFNGGVEIRCLGRHKGDALRELLFDHSENTFAVYIGDDETDEDAFMVLKNRGIALKVGGSTSSTAATGFLADCKAVRDFLATWCSLTSPQ